MILTDIHELSETPDYASYPKTELNELRGFQVLPMKIQFEGYQMRDLVDDIGWVIVAWKDKSG